MQGEFQEVWKMCNTKEKNCHGSFNLTARTNDEHTTKNNKRSRHDACDNKSCQNSAQSY